MKKRIVTRIRPLSFAEMRDFVVKYGFLSTEKSKDRKKV